MSVVDNRPVTQGMTQPAPSTTTSSSGLTMAGLAGAATTPKRVRLALALSTSGLVFGATSAGPWAFWASSLFALVPPVIAMRSLPLWLGVVVAVLPGAIGRAIAYRYDEPALGLAVATLAASASLLPALVVDRFLWLKLPRLTILTLPALVVATVVVVELALGADVAGYVAAVPDVDALTVLPAVLPGWGPLFVTLLVVQGFAAIGTQFNMPVDSLPRPTRERGVRWCLLVAFAFVFLIGVVGLIW